MAQTWHKMCWITSLVHCTLLENVYRILSVSLFTVINSEMFLYIILKLQCQITYRSASLAISNYNVWHLKLKSNHIWSVPWIARGTKCAWKIALDGNACSRKFHVPNSKCPKHPNIDGTSNPEETLTKSSGCERLTEKWRPRKTTTRQNRIFCRGNTPPLRQFHGPAEDMSHREYPPRQFSGDWMRQAWSHVGQWENLCWALATNRWLPQIHISSFMTSI